MVARYVPDAGDIVWLQFDPQAGREGVRERVVVVRQGTTRDAGLGGAR